MESKSLFEQFSEQDISHWVNLFSLGTILLGISVGFLRGWLRKSLQKNLVLGFMYGLVGPLIALSWHFIDARTSYWDYTYRETNPGHERILWPIVGAGKLDSVSNLIGLTATFIFFGLFVGLGYGYLIRKINPPHFSESESVSKSTKLAKENSNS